MLAIEVACGDVSSEAICQASTDFIAGRVAGCDKRFCPSPATFADHARLIHDRIEAVKAARARLAIEGPRSKPKPEREITPQERERVAAKMRAYCDELKRKAEAETDGGGDRNEFRRSLFERGNQAIGPTALEILQRSGKIERD